MMEIRQHNTFNEINKKDWDTLLQKSGVNVPFLKYGYLKRWWEHKGGGEWPDAKLHLISMWENGILTGIAPLFMAEHEGRQKAMLLGSIEISDYLDFIYEPQNAREFFSQLFTFLSNNASEAFENILLYNIPESSPSIPLLEEESGEQRWQIQSEHAYHTPAITLTQDWEYYLAGLDKKQRHEIRRKLRRTEENEASIQWYIVKDKDSLEEEMDDFFSLMILDKAKQEFLSEDMRAQMRSIIDWAFDEGILQLSFFTVDGKKAAAYLCFDYMDRIWVYNSGYDPQFREFSPGWVLLSYLIQHAIETGKQTFDFMRGDEDYKYRFGAEDSFVLKLEITK